LTKTVIAAPLPDFHQKFTVSQEAALQNQAPDKSHHPYSQPMAAIDVQTFIQTQRLSLPVLD
jgi:hypothetical protein